jgi:hypothetical protein
MWFGGDITPLCSIFSVIIATLFLCLLLVFTNSLTSFDITDCSELSAHVIFTCYVMLFVFMGVHCSNIARDYGTRAMFLM